MATKKTSLIPNFVIGEPVKGHQWGGLNTSVKDVRFLGRGESPDEVNWITSTKQDNIQLRRGKALLGQTDRNGNPVSGLGIGIRNDGLQVPFFTYDQKIMFYDNNDDDTEEVDTSNIFPLEASGEGMNIMPYTNLAGSFVYLTSPHSSIYKIPVANPGSVVDLDSKDYRFGFSKINRSRMFGMNRNGNILNSRDNTGLYISHVDKQLVTDYTNNFMTFPPYIVSAISSNIAGGGLTNGGIYYINITAIGPSGAETTITNTKDSGGILITSPKNSIVLSWQNVAGAIGYKIYLTQSILMYLSSHSGPLFATSDVVTGSTSGAKGVVVSNSGGGLLFMDTLSVAPFQPGETVTAPSGASGVISSDPILSVLGNFQVTNSLGYPDTITPATGALNVLNLVNNPIAGVPPTSTIQKSISKLATGDGHTKIFSGTISIPSPNTLFYMSITDGIELFLDDKSGNLVGSLGGTGTINYATGAYSVTFNTAPTNGYPITGSFYEENSNTDGISSFIPDPSDTNNVSGQVFRQDEGGGKAEAVWPYQGVEYCFHLLRSWLLDITLTQGVYSFDNQPYYEQIGIPNRFGAFPKGDGIIFINMADPTHPKFSKLEIPVGSTNLTVKPTDLSSDFLDLSMFSFDKAVVFSANNYDILCCANFTNGKLDSYNSVTFIRDNTSGIWNKLDYTINVLAEYTGGLLSGDSISPNLFQLFNGFDDEGQVISNYWKSSLSDLGLEGMKKVGYFNVQGIIQASQKIKVSYSLDGGDYIEIFTIDGQGDYVNKSSPIGIGTFSIGANLIGGGQTVQANSFEVDIPVHTDLFQFISFRIEAIDIGYAQIDKFQYKDIRFKRRRILSFNDPNINNP